MPVKVKKQLLSSLLLLALTSCASQAPTDDPLASFNGKPVSEARAVLGKANRYYDMQNGTLEYIWSETYGKAASTGFMGVEIASGSPSSCNQVLITNEEKIVLASRYEGKCRR